MTVQPSKGSVRAAHPSRNTEPSTTDGAPPEWLLEALARHSGNAKAIAAERGNITRSGITYTLRRYGLIKRAVELRREKRHVAEQKKLDARKLRPMRDLRLRPDGAYDLMLSKELTAIVDADCIELISPYGWRYNTRYVVRRLERGEKPSSTYLHRVIMADDLAAAEAAAGHRLIVDHVNGNVLDNRRANLRLATDAQNARNKEVGSMAGTSRRGRKWRAEIYVNGKRIYLGSFESPKAAADAYWAAREKFFGEFKGRRSSEPSRPRKSRAARKPVTQTAEAAP